MNFNSFLYSDKTLGDNILIDGVSRFIGETILTGMLLEVASYPKPGLVSSRSQGAHSDMNILTFMLSSSAISSSFPIFAQTGQNCSGDPETLLSLIRTTGAEYERKLLSATDQVNTQRGILFAGGILSAAAGYSYRINDRHSTDDIFNTVSLMTRGICERELNPSELSGKCNPTAGEKLFMQYGTTGIRGEVELGFPSVQKAGLPAFYEAIERGVRLNDCLVHALISLMTYVEDSTILWRKGPDALELIKNTASLIIEKGSVFTSEGRKEIAGLNETCLKENISPGGSADLLTITVSSYLLTNRFFPVLKM